jgi:hypothetical protein
VSPGREKLMAAVAKGAGNMRAKLSRGQSMSRTGGARSGQEQRRTQSIRWDRRAYGYGPVPRFRLDFSDDGSSIDIEADDFDDDGEWISLYNYAPADADPLDPETTKDVIASFQRSSLVGPPRPIQ